MASNESEYHERRGGIPRVEELECYQFLVHIIIIIIIIIIIMIIIIVISSSSSSRQ